MRNYYILFLGLTALSSISRADLNLPERAVQIRVSQIHTIGGNIAENSVRNALATALTDHTLSSLAISRFTSNVGRGLLFNVRISTQQLGDVLQDISNHSTGSAAQFIKISYPRE